MSRIIKFRAWIDGEAWYLGDERAFMFWEDGKLNITYVSGIYEGTDEVYSTISEGFILEQFTGLQDCEGKDIYEGDLVRYSYKSEYRNYSFIGVVEHDTCNPCFVIVNPDNSNQIEFDWVMCGLATLEITGNIHEESP